jgi:4-alpha-glucanotransferase
LRIDHILGFFRIWQIPLDQIEGTMGMFNPRKPYSREELSSYGFYGDLSRFILPYITELNLTKIFGQDGENYKSIFFELDQEGRVRFRNEFNTQKKIHEFISRNKNLAKFEKDLFLLVSEVLLLEEPSSNGQYFNPRITLSTTSSYNELDDSLKSKLTVLYNDYYFHRHDEFWKEQALRKLPAILDASDMLICGEDLGMIPNSVPGVMKAMNIISLEIQRMPKGNNRFGQVSEYPYFSVCSPSCHDMSTIRGWWEADHENAKEFYYNYLGFNGLTPKKCSPEIVEAIIEDHLASPSLFAIFPIQDLIALDQRLSKEDAFSEQINEPSNPKHYWRYRCHLTTEDLLKAIPLNQKIHSLVSKHR